MQRQEVCEHTDRLDLFVLRRVVRPAKSPNSLVKDEQFSSKESGWRNLHPLRSSKLIFDRTP